MKVPAQNQSIVHNDIAPRAIARILATIAVVWLTYELRLVVLMLVVALILAGTFNPLVEWLEERRVRRVYALMLVLVALTACAAFLLFLTLPPLIEQLTQMVQSAPATRARLIAILGDHDVTRPLAHVVQSAGLEQAFRNIESGLMGYSSQAVRMVGYGATTLALSFYLLADGKRVQGAVYALVPRDYHMRLARIIQNMETIVGGYMRGQLITSTAIGVFTFLLLLVCKVPNALSLALFAALTDVIPFIGGLMIIPIAALAALPNGLPVAGAVLVALSVYTEFESRILVPRVYGQVLRLSPTMVILALVAGGTLMGVMGALVALPIAAGLLMILEELRVDMPGDDSIDRAESARQARTEATYQQMSAGTTAPEAGQIAKHLAHDLRDADVVHAAKELNETAP
jgi:predicted PurR-regulated permease PerM